MSDQEQPQLSAYEALKATNLKWALFVDAYVISLNRSEAVRAAGYKYTGTGAAVSASKQGAILLANAKVRAAIEEKLNAAKMGKGEVLTRLTDQASIDPSALLKVGPKGLEIDWQAAKAAGLLSHIKSIRQTRAGVQVEFIDRQKALELLGRHHRLFSDVVTMGDKPDQTAKQLTDAELLAIAQGANPEDLTQAELSSLAEQLGLEDDRPEVQ